MNKTLFENVWEQHVVKQVDRDMDVIFIDRHYIHEVTSPQAFMGLKKRGIGVFMPERTTATADHNIPTQNQHLPIQNELSAKQVNTLEANCREHNIEYFGMGHEKNGIVHVIGPELGLTQPGMTIVCGDSHTSTHGAFGSIAFGIGTSQVEQVLAAQSLILNRPKTLKIEVNGSLGQGVTAKDLILYIISRMGTEGATGYFVEYAGSTFAALSMEERMTVCNMTIEMGARGGMVGIDQTTLDYVRAHTNYSEEDFARISAQWLSLNSGADASFDRVVSYQAKAIRPMVTFGTAPDTGISLHELISGSNRVQKRGLEYMGFNSDQKVSGEKIDYVFIGSCTNSRLEDLRSAAHLVQGKKVAGHVTAWVVPGSQKVLQDAKSEGIYDTFIQAGFEFREPGCSACLAMNDDKIPAGSLCVSTSNRNFEGRQGAGARTILASPLTASASALTGYVTDPLQFLQ